MLFIVRILLFLAFLFPFTPIWGTMVLPLNLKQMTKQAEKIFVGRCQESAVELDENGIPATYVRFQVLQPLKGVSEGETVLIKQYGVLKEPLQVREGEKAIVPLKSISLSPKGYRPGEEYLLFFYPESILGFTSPVGAGQGKFEVLTDKQGLKVVQNPASYRLPVKFDRMIETVQKLVVHE